MKDVTLIAYKQLLQSLISKDYKFLTVEEYIILTSSPSHPLILMRHDVDRKPQNSLRMAKLENEFGIKATYYFRTIPKTFKPEIIKEIAELGHEIGYHYENLSIAEILIKNLKFKIKNEEEFEEKIFELAIEDFEKNLYRLRKLYSVKSIAMHGRPLSKWDNRLLWKKYDYKDYGILSEPYFDIDFNKVLYITDAGRSWNNESINLRDKVDSKFIFSFKHTDEIISSLNNNKLPEKIMINIHPEHWTDSNLEWWKIWVVRKIKNFGKRIIIRGRARRRKSEV